MGFRGNWNLSIDLEHLRNEFDELLEQLGSEHRNLEDPSTELNRQPVESFLDGDDFVVQIRLPGVNPKNIDLQVVDEILTVKVSLLRDELRYGTIERAIPLPQGVKAEHLHAIYRDMCSNSELRCQRS